MTAVSIVVLVMCGLTGGCMALYVAVGGMGEGNTEDEPIPLTFQIRIGARTADEAPDVDLHLGAADVEALQLPAPVVVGRQGSVEVRSPRTDADGAARTHCLADPADLVEKGSGVVVVTIPAGTCIGKDDLVVPTERAPEIDAQPESYADPTGPIDVAPLIGPLVVTIDGCSTIAGRRVVWPQGTTIDEYGRIRLAGGRLLSAGETVTVITRQPDGLGIPEWCSGVPAFVEEVR